VSGVTGFASYTPRQVAKRREVNAKMILLSFLILGSLTLLVYIEEKLNEPEPVLGEEWDFLRPVYLNKGNRNSI
jgi:hypothetical protein